MFARLVLIRTVRTKITKSSCSCKNKKQETERTRRIRTITIRIAKTRITITRSGTIKTTRSNTTRTSKRKIRTMIRIRIQYIQCSNLLSAIRPIPRSEILPVP